MVAVVTQAFEISGGSRHVSIGTPEGLTCGIRSGRSGLRGTVVTSLASGV